MKRLKNKFIIGVIFLIVVIICSQIYRAYSSNAIDTNSYISLIKGMATLNSNPIQKDNSSILVPGDTVRTIGKESLAVIEWGDGSITRLGGNTKISVGNNEVSRDFTKIDISFDLIAGKTWSNVVSFISRESSFTQTFQGVEAGVRGTIFDVDLLQKFVHVTDHKITLTDGSGETYSIGEGTSLSLSNFSLIELSQFLNTLRDDTWNDINKQLDEENIEKLKEEIALHLESNNPFLFLLEVFSPKYRFLYELDNRADFKKLKKILPLLSDDQKGDVYKVIFSRYQKLNFVAPSDSENYKTKLLYKRLLIILSDQKDKEILVETSLYDFKDILSSQNSQAFASTVELLNENKEILKGLDMSIFTKEINLIPDDLEMIIRENFSNVQGVFKGSLPDTQDVDFSNIKDVADDTFEKAGEKLLDTKDKAQEAINTGLDTLFDSFAN